MMASWGWSLLGVLLILNGFGLFWTFHIIVCLVAFAFGIIVIFYRYGQSRKEELLAELSSAGDSYPFTPGLKELLSMKPLCAKPTKEDCHVTGSQIIDSELDDILSFALRDFVQVWYKDLSTDETFMELLRCSATRILHNLSVRMRQVDWVPFLTRNLVDDFASHIRLYRKSVERLEQSRSCAASNEDLESIFFDLELEMEKKYCRDFVSTSTQYEKAYLRDISDVLLFLVMPKEEFASKPLRLLLREVVVSRLLLPLVDQLSDPDYVNQTIVWLLGEIPIDYEVFLSVLEDSEHLDELTAVRECLDHEIAAQRSKDTGDAVKQQLNSLVFVRKQVDQKLEELKDECDSPVRLFREKKVSREGSLPELSLGYIVNNPVALSYLIDFLSSTDGQNLIYFYLAVEGFKLSAGQHLSSLHLQRVTRPSSSQQEILQDMETVREAALSLYDQYLSDKAAVENRVALDEALLKKLLNSLLTQEPSECCFDQAQAKVYELLQSDKYYGSFKRSEVYSKLLSELDIGRNSSPLEQPTLPAERSEDSPDADQVVFSTGGKHSVMKMSAHITQIGMSKEGPKAFAVYIIKVAQESGQNTPVHSWIVHRRYSDFHDLHLIIQAKFPSLAGISFPGKKTFNNLNQDFLEGRKRALNAYLKNLLYPDLFQTHKGLEIIMTRFLSSGPFNQGRGVTNISKKVDLFVNPILTGVKSVSNAVISMPDNFVDGVSKVGDNLGKVTRTVLGIGSQPLKPPIVISSPEGRVGAALEVENTADNIPLRIVLLLMDEVFNLRQRNQWFRRRLVAFLQQLTRATFGGSINRKIVDFVQFLTCEEQVGDYLRAFKTAFWPNGQLFDSVQERSKAVQMRTRVVAKAKLIAALPDELRLFIGNETTRKGALLVFEAFQNSHLNRRFTYVLLEHLLKTIFQHNRFDQIFLKLHSKSPRCQAMASLNAN